MTAPVLRYAFLLSHTADSFHSVVFQQMNKAPIPIRIVLRLGRLGKKTFPRPLRKFLEVIRK